jgi:hypothetical protein
MEDPKGGPQAPTASERKKYEKPALTEFGRVRDLTQALTGGGVNNDMAMGPEKT